MLSSPKSARLQSITQICAGHNMVSISHLEAKNTGAFQFVSKLYILLFYRFHICTISLQTSFPSSFQILNHFQSLIFCFFPLMSCDSYADHIHSTTSHHKWIIHSTFHIKRMKVCWLNPCPSNQQARQKPTSVRFVTAPIGSFISERTLREFAKLAICEMRKTIRTLKAKVPTTHDLIKVLNWCNSNWVW